MGWNKTNLFVLVFLFFFSTSFVAAFFVRTGSLRMTSTASGVEDGSVGLDSAAWVWNDTMVVSTESTANSEHPAVAIDKEGNVHVAWADSTDYMESDVDKDIFYKCRDVTTGTWSVTEVVSNESTGASILPDLCVDDNMRVHVVWQDETDWDLEGDRDLCYKRRDANGSWTTTVVVSNESTIHSYVHPKVAVDSTGCLHAVWLETPGSNWFIKYKNKSLGGSWSAPEQVSNTTTGNAYRPDMTVDGQGSVQVTWADDRDYNGAGGDWDIFYRCRAAQTGTWTTIEVVSTESTGDSHVSGVTVDSAGTVHVVWFDVTDLGCGADQDIFYKYRNATTGLWTTTEVISEGFNGDGRHPAIEADINGNLHVVWHDTSDFNGAGTDFDIFYRRWNITTGTWMPIEVVSNGTGDTSWRPELAVDHKSNVHIVWQDLTNYTGCGTDSDIFYQGPSVELPPFPEDDGLEFSFWLILIISIVAAAAVIVIVLRQRRKQLLR